MARPMSAFRGALRHSHASNVLMSFADELRVRLVVYGRHHAHYERQIKAGIPVRRA